MYGPMLSRPPRLCMKASLPGVGRRLTHRLQIGRAALLEQSANAAMEVLHPQSQELGNEVVGAATPGDAPCASDDLDATLHRLLHVRVGLLAGEPHRLRKVSRPDEVHVHPWHGNQIRQVLDGLHFFDHQAHEGLAVGFTGIVRGGALDAVASVTTAAENSSITPSGPYFTASTAARASSAVLTWGTFTPQAPRSRNGAIISGLFPTGRTIGAMPLSSAAAMHASALSTVMEPCSLSSRIQSKPR